MGVQLLLDGLRLGVASPEAGHVDHVVTAMGEACERLRPGPDPNWSLHILPGHPVLEESRAWPRLELRPGGPSLTITGNQNGRLRAVGYYRPQSAPVAIAVCTERSAWSRRRSSRTASTGSRLGQQRTKR